MFSSRAPVDLGVREGRLKPCPETPNCVSSHDQGRAHIAPLPFEGAPDAAIPRLKSILSELPRVRVVEESAGYLRAEALSRVFGFVDDLEFQLEAAARVLHVRSAARLGRSDFGVNRRRIEAIRSRFSPPTSGR